MSISNLHIFSRDTDATASLRGYQFQVLKTLEIWLQNYIDSKEEDIYCDFEDDIFQKSESRKVAKFSQIKLYSSNFSFKSEEIEKSIVNFFMLHIKTDYRSFDKEFIFQANSSIAQKYKDNDAELLRQWYENQESLPTQILTKCSKKVKEIVSNYIRDQAQKDKGKERKNLVKSGVKALEKLNDEDWNDFTKCIRWRFSEVSPDDEFQTVKRNIEELISKLPFPIPNEKITSILGLLHKVVWDKATELIPIERILNLSLLESYILSEGTSEDKWYMEVKEKWEKVDEINYFFIGEYFEIIDAAKHCRRHKYLFKHDVVWLKLLDNFINDSKLNRSLSLGATYEYVWLKIKAVDPYSMPEGDLNGVEEYVRSYFGSFDDFQNASELENAQSILHLALTSCYLDLSKLEFKEVKSWYVKLEKVLRQRISESSSPSETCHLLENLSTFHLFFIIREDKENNYDQFTSPLNQLLELINKADFYDVSQLSHRLNMNIKLLINIYGNQKAELIDLLDEYSQKFDKVVQSREGSFKSAKVQVERGGEYMNSEDPKLILRALNCFHRAKDLWRQQESIEGLVLALINISQLYSGIELNLAAKYYALAGVWASTLNSNKKTLKRIADSLGMLFYAEFKQGSWINAITAFNHYFRARQEFNPNPIDLEKEEMPFKIIADFATLIYSSKLLSPQISVLLDLQITNSGNLGNDYLQPIINELEKSYQTEDSLQKLLEQKLTDVPLNDMGKTRVIKFKALGSQWEISFINDYQTNSIAEEFCAILQIMLGEIAFSKSDFHLLKSAIKIELEVKAGKKTPEQLPSNSESRWKVYLNYFDSKDSKEINDDISIKAGALMIILNSVSLLPFEEFCTNFKALFTDNHLASKTLPLNTYQNMYRMVFKQDGFNSLERIHFNQPELKFQNLPWENDILNWKSVLSYKYDKEQSLEYIAGRYRNSLKVIGVTLDKLKSNKEFISLISKHREDGWQDWQIITAMSNFILDYKTRKDMESLDIKNEDKWREKHFEIFQKYSRMKEEDCYIYFPVEAFQTIEFQMQLENSCFVVLKNFGLEYKANFPNFKAVKEFLDIRMNVINDKDDVNNPLIDIKLE